MIKLTVSFFSILLSFQSVSYAAGFDCSLNTLNETEATICGNSYLDGLDNMSNKLFTKAKNNTLSLGVLINDQKAWVKNRNKCSGNYECIKNIYLERNVILSRISEFKSVLDVFNSDDIIYDESNGNDDNNKTEDKKTNANGYSLVYNQWLVKNISEVPSKSDNFNKNIRTGDWEILSHLNIDDNVFFFFKVNTNKSSSYLILVSDYPGESVIISRYDSNGYQSPEIQVIKKGNDYLTYSVNNVYDDKTGRRTNKYYRVDFSNVKNIKSIDIDASWIKSKVTEIVNAEEIAGLINEYKNQSDKNNDWMGYCDEKLCRSNTVSANKKWHIASGDYEGVYIFPEDRPDISTNVFFDKKKYETVNFAYGANFDWGNENQFFFSITGGPAGLWKTDIDKKTTENILSVSQASKPYYFRFNDVDYVLSYFDEDFYFNNFFVSKDIEK